MFAENARFDVLRDTRDLLTSADLRVYLIRINCIAYTFCIMCSLYWYHFA